MEKEENDILGSLIVSAVFFVNRVQKACLRFQKLNWWLWWQQQWLIATIYVKSNAFLSAVSVVHAFLCQIGLWTWNNSWCQIHCALVKSKLYPIFGHVLIACKRRRTVDRNPVLKKKERSANAGKKITHIICESVRRQRIIMLTVIVSHTCYNW